MATDLDMGSRLEVNFRWILVATVGLVVLPTVTDLWLGDEARVFGYLASDFFYYFTVAQNYIDLGEVSFDQSTATNGFHPLWQLCLVALWGLASAIDCSDTEFFNLVVVLNTVLLATGLAFVAVAWKTVSGRVSSLFPLIVPGVFAILTAPLYNADGDLAAFQIEGGERPIVGTMWNFANGMETGLVVLFFGLAIRWLVGHWVPRRRRDSVAFALLLGLLTFSRLDHVFIASSLLLAGWTLAWTRSERRELRFVFEATIVYAILIGLYLVYNKIAYGVATPISGSVKTTFPYVTADNMRQVHDLFRIHGDRPIWIAYRQAQLLLPAVALVVEVVLTFRLRVTTEGAQLTWRSRANSVDRLLIALAPGIFLLAFYNFFFVPPIDQGTWYFPVSILYVSLVALRWAEPLVLRARSIRASFGVLVAVIAASLGFFFVSNYRPNFHRDVASYYLVDVPKIVEFYRTKGVTPNVISYYDGAFAAASRFPTFNGFGLVVDLEAMKARRRDEVITIAYERGFDRIHSFYFDGTSLPDVPTRENLLGLVAAYIKEEELKNLEIEIEYMNDARKYVVLKLSDKKPEPPKKKKKKKSRNRRNRRGKRAVKPNRSGNPVPGAKEDPQPAPRNKTGTIPRPF